MALQCHKQAWSTYQLVRNKNRVRKKLVLSNLVPCHVHQNCKSSIRFRTAVAMNIVSLYLLRRGNKNSTTKDINRSFLNVHRHLMVVNQLRSSYDSCVFRDLGPFIRLDIVNEKVALQVLRCSVLRVQISAKSEKLPTFWIEAHLVTRSRGRTTLQFLL